MKLNNNDDSHNSGLNLLIYNMLLDIESHPTWVCGLKQTSTVAKSMLFISDVSKQDQRIFLVEPKHPATATGI